MKKEEIRKELENYLSEKKGSGKTGERAEYTKSFAITLLMNIWVSPKPELTSLRDRLLAMLSLENSETLCHWVMVSSAYPFWFNMSYIFGSLFSLQDQVKMSQIMSRTYEIFGERNTVNRCSRYVNRSLAAWDLIRDKEKPGYYEKGKVITVSDIDSAGFLAEAMLHALPEKRLALSAVINCPAFFNFKLPPINGAQLAKANQNLYVEQFSVNEKYISLKSYFNR
jgi:hypothetical protein